MSPHRRSPASASGRRLVERVSEKRGRARPEVVRTGEREAEVAALFEVEHGSRHWPTIPRLSRCEMVSAITLTAMTIVASALISGVMPKRIIE